jgi:hypothetical protein
MRKEKSKKVVFFTPSSSEKPKKFTDMCELCIEGRRAQNQLNNLLETGIYENKEVEDLKKKIQNFEKHYEVRQKQREKFKEEIKTLHRGAGVLVIDFSSNLKLNLELIQKNKDHYNKPQRTLFGATLVYVDENENRKFFYFDIVSEILDHNAYFVNKALFKILNHSVFKSKQIKELKI